MIYGCLHNWKITSSKITIVIFEKKNIIKCKFDPNRGAYWSQCIFTSRFHANCALGVINCKKYAWDLNDKYMFCARTFRYAKSAKKYIFIHRARVAVHFWTTIVFPPRLETLISHEFLHACTQTGGFANSNLVIEILVYINIKYVMNCKSI